MAELTTKQRKKLPKDEFALPEQRKYPIDTPARAANAKARAAQMVAAGHLSVSAQHMIDAAANKVLNRNKKKK